MVISALSIVANVFVLILHHRNVKIKPPMPKWVSAFKEWIVNYYQ